MTEESLKQGDDLQAFAPYATALMISPSTGVMGTARDVVNLVANNNISSALDFLDPYRNRSEPWALSLSVFIRTTYDTINMLDAYPDVLACRDLGMNWVVGWYAQKFYSNISILPSSDEQSAQILRLLAKSNAPWPNFSPIFDVMTNAWNLLTDDHAMQAIQLFSLRNFTMKTGHTAWDQLVADTEAQLQFIEQQEKSVTDIAEAISQRAAEVTADFERTQEDLTSKANAANILITQVSDSTSRKLFEEDAQASGSAQFTAFVMGVVVLAAAAGAALLPLVLHYMNKGPDYSAGALLAAHGSVSVALAALAGVLLARSRTRDQARQRSRDLATVMGTMINYSQHIADAEQRQAFEVAMVRSVLEAHLRADPQTSKSDGNSVSGAVELVNAFRKSSTQ